MYPKKLLEWVSIVKELSIVANQHFPYSAYTGMNKSLQHQWTFFQRVIPNIAQLLLPAENAIAEYFVPAIYGKK